MRHQVVPVSGWTDHPIRALGDEPGVLAPIRPCEVFSWDRNKYATIRVGGVWANIKLCYIYTAYGRCFEVPALTVASVSHLPSKDPDGVEPILEWRV